MPHNEVTSHHMLAYYNEIDRYCCDWLSNLMDAGLIAPGEIDDRRIEDLGPDDVRGYERVHFFAGIGGWDYALRLAGWPAARPVWTGSCPCQPFSAAGQGKAADDERHLWPEWFRLIRVVRPATVFGEQVESAIGWGWVDLVHADLAAKDYATRFTVLPACGVGAPHIRNRVWFVADAERSGWAEGRTIAGDGPAAGGGMYGMADTDAARYGARRTGEASNDGAAWIEPAGFCSDILGQPDSGGLSEGGETATVDGYGHSAIAAGRDDCIVDDASGQQVGRAGQPWQDCTWIACSDGKARPTKPGIFPLAHGVPGRVGQLRAAGNAIVPQVAAEFIKATMTCE